MVFSSLTFLFFFLPACLISYYAFPSRAVRNLILAGFSLLFYAWGEPIWITLMLFSAVWDFGNGLIIERYRAHRSIARLGLFCSLFVNLGLLVSFKYAGFIVETVNAITSLEFDKPNILLPIGISFYTFQTISYTIDVYRGEVKAQRRFLNFLLFVVCFHQLVAGPIVRYAHVAREIESRLFSLSDFTEGITRFCKGLFKKVFIANVAGELSVQFLGRAAAESSIGGEWFGLLMFAVQIYYDFSGYSDMAIGLGKMFGFNYHENFRHPYVATSVTDFWRRWHISLGTFFRDYVYIPLGGNRRNQIRNLLIVWALTGLWHGASWNFVLWGLYFGVILWLEKKAVLRLLNALPVPFSHLYTLSVVVLGWAIFFFTDLARLSDSVQILFGLKNVPFGEFELEAAVAGNFVWLVFALTMCAPVYSFLHTRLRRTLPSVLYQNYLIVQSLGLLAVSTALLVGRTYNPFIYFRF